MSRYKYTKLRNLGPVHGFLIHTPDDRELIDTHPQTIVRELNRMADRINKLEEELMHVMNKHAVLVADVVLNEDRGDRIKRLEELGHELRECASRIGTVASGEASIIRRTQEAIEEWDNKTK